MSNSEFNRYSKHLERVERKERMSNSANGINMWDLDPDHNFSSESQIDRGRDAKND